MNITQAKRPTALHIAAIIGFIMVILSIPSIFSPFIKKLGTLYPMLFGTLVSLRFIALVGVWYMKKWGPKLFLVVFLIFEAASAFSGIDRYIEFPISMILCSIFLAYVNVMDDNL